MLFFLFVLVGREEEGPYCAESEKAVAKEWRTEGVVRKRERSEESTEDGDMCASAGVSQDALSRGLCRERSLLRQWKGERENGEARRAFFLRSSEEDCGNEEDECEAEDVGVSAVGVETEDITLPMVGGCSGGRSRKRGFSKERLTIATLCASSMHPEDTSPSEDALISEVSPFCCVFCFFLFSLDAFPSACDVFS